MEGRKQIVADSNAIGRLVGSRADVAASVRWLVANNAELVLLEQVGAEVVSGRNTRAAFRRAQGIRRLVDAGADRVQIGLSCGHVFEAEEAAPLFRTPLVAAEVDFRFRSGFREITRNKREFIRSRRRASEALSGRAKDGWLEADQRVQDHLSKQFPDVQSRLDCANQLVKEWPTRFNKGHWLVRRELQQEDRCRTFEEQLGSGRRRCLLALACIADANAYGSVLEIPKGHALDFFRCERGNWADAQIAATAAYADSFVTSDRRLRQVLRFMKRHGQYDPEVKRPEDFPGLFPRATG